MTFVRLLQEQSQADAHHNNSYLGIGCRITQRLN